MENEAADALIELLREDYVLVAREFTYLEGDEMGVAVKLSDGTWTTFGIKAEPTEAEFNGISFPSGSLPYAEKRALVIAQAGLDPDDLPWVSYDADGMPIAATETDEALEQWLHHKVLDTRLEYWGSEISEHGIALQLLSGLPKSELQALGLNEVDLGSPASSVRAVRMTGSVEQFNSTMRRFRLRFLLVDDKRE